MHGKASVKISDAMSSVRVFMVNQNTRFLQSLQSQDASATISGLSAIAI
jgi:hypothetical protein